MQLSAETSSGSPARPDAANSPTPERPGTATSHQQRLLGLALNLIRLGPGIVLLIAVVVMSLLTPTFFTVLNLTNLAVQSAVVCLTALGQLLVIVARGIDLSIGSVIALTGVVGTLLFYHGTITNGLFIVVIMLAVGAAVGLLNGVLATKGRVAALIVTLAGLYALRGIALVLSDGSPIPASPPLVNALGGGQLGPLPAPVLVVLACVGVAALITRRTQLGRWIYAIGGNPEAARRLGIPVSKVVITLYVFSGLAAGLAGVLTAGRSASGFPNAGELGELNAVAAVIIGGASLMGGRGSVSGTVVGALLLGVIANGLNLLNVNPFWQEIATGAVILLAVQLDVLRQHLEVRFRSHQTELVGPS